MRYSGLTLVPLDPYTYASINKESFIRKYGDAAKKFIAKIEVEMLESLLLKRKRKNVNWKKFIKRVIESRKTI